MILSYLRTLFLYLVLIFAVRLMGKRQIGEMEPAEFVVTMLVANLAAIPMQDGAIPLYSGLVPILTVLGLELVLSGAILRSVNLRKLLCGKPVIRRTAESFQDCDAVKEIVVILIDNGKILQDNLRSARINLDELTGHLREKDVLDIRTVQFAILETNGNLSVFPYPKEKPASAKDAGISAGKQYLPVTILEDGYLSRDNLRRAGKDEVWLKKVLAQQGADIDSTFLLTVDAADHVLWLGKESK